MSAMSGLTLPLAMREPPRWLVRVGPRLGLFVVGLLSVALLWLSYQRLTATSENATRVVATLAQTELETTRAYLIIQQAANGDPTVSIADARGHLDHAERQARELARLTDTGSGTVLLGDSARAHIGVLTLALARMQTLVPAGVAVQQPGAAVERRVVFADLLRATAALERDVQSDLAAMRQKADRWFLLLLTSWTVFIVGMLGVAQALARARGRTEGDLRESEFRYRQLSTLAPVGIFRANLQGVCQDVNDRWEGLTGVSSRRAIGQEWFANAHPEDLLGVRDRWQRAVAAHQDFQYEFRYAMGSRGFVWVLAQAAPAPGSYVGTLIDISQRKQVEAQLQQAQKLEAVGQLTGGIAHDFNNLLAVIQANGELLAGGDLDAAMQADAMADIRAAAASGADLVRGLLGFARRADLQFASVSLREIVEQTMRLLRRMLPAHISLRFVTPDSDVVVRADRGALQQMLFNLATNARDAMPEGGTLTLEVQRRVVDEVYIATHPWVLPGNYGVVVARDDGVGMDAATREHIFEPFFTTKRTGQGTGLGLAMTYGLVKQHGGFVHVYSELGAGTTFQLGFPESDAPTRSDARPSTRAKIRPTAPERVLVVDDEAALRRTTCRTLERLGYTVREAAGGEAALALALEESFDLILSDLVMPDFGGATLHARVREAGRRVPFLFTSGYTSRDVVERAVLPDGAMFLPKPWSIDELDQAVRNAMHGGTVAP